MSEGIEARRGVAIPQHSTITRDDQGNIYVRLGEQMDEPEAGWLDRVDWRRLDRLASSFAGGFLLYAAAALLWWVGMAVWRGVNQ